MAQGTALAPAPPSIDFSYPFAHPFFARKAEVAGATLRTKKKELLTAVHSNQMRAVMHDRAAQTGNLPDDTRAIFTAADYINVPQPQVSAEAT